MYTLTIHRSDVGNYGHPYTYTTLLDAVNAAIRALPHGVDVTAPYQADPTTLVYSIRDRYGNPDGSYLTGTVAIYRD